MYERDREKFLYTNFQKDKIDMIERSKQEVFKVLYELENKGYYFHNLDHTQKVLERSTYLAEKEGINEEQKEMIQLASLFHDTGQIEKSAGHELVSTVIAENFLKTENYPSEKIDKVKKIILASIPSHIPSDITEMILKDADIDNLGRDDFFVCSSLLREEIRNVHNRVFSDKQWFLNLSNFLKGQRFYTSTQINERQEKFEENFQRIKEFLEEL